MAAKVYVELKDLSPEERETKSVLENNGEPVYYLPIEINHPDQLETLGITRDQCRMWRIGREWKYVHLTPCDKETYTLLSRELWAQQSREYRNNRCMVPGKIKLVVRCPESNKCDACPFGMSPWNRQPNLISFDNLMDMDREPCDSESVEQQVFQKMELLKLKEMMDEEDKRLFQIFVLMYLMDYNRYNISQEFHISWNRADKLVNLMNETILQYRLMQ